MPKPPNEFLNPDGLSPPGPAGYSHVAKVNRGTIVYLSGQVPIDAAGGVMADIVKLNYYVAAELDPANVPKLRPIRDRYLNMDSPPASTFLVVARLMRPGWLIEIEAVAAIGD